MTTPSNGSPAGGRDLQLGGYLRHDVPTALTVPSHQMDREEHPLRRVRRGST